jgi:hypothetical protein
LCMYELTTRIRKEVPHYLLDEEEKVDVYLEWLKTSIEKSDALTSEFLKNKKI